MQQGVRACRVCRRLIIGHPGGQDAGGIRVKAQPLGHIQPGGHQGGIVGVAQSIVSNTGLLDLKMLHGAGQGLLVLVPASL